MFEHFTFAAPAQSNRQHVKSESTSPTNISFPFPPISRPEWDTTNQSNQPSVDSIAQQFSIQSLDPSLENEESQKSIWNNTIASPIIDFDSDSDSNDFTSEDLSYVSTTRGMARVQADFSAPRGTLANRRMQRQRNVQLQSNSNHVRDIKTLVSGMIENNSQCKLRKSTSRPSLHSPPPSRGGIEEREREGERRGGDHGSGSDMDLDILCSYDRAITPDIEDEGFGDDDELIAAIKEEVASLRRTSTPSGIRKNVRRYRSSETLGGGLSGGLGRDTKIVDGKMKVRCLPRMRKRNKVSSPGVVPE